jgi:multicomponent Na+:H+ antiporter subunit E
MEVEMNSRISSSDVRTAAIRMALFAALWLVLTRGSLDDGWLAAVAVVAATVTSMLLWKEPVWRLRPGGLMRFVPFFLVQSVLGGWDVARRAGAPSLPLAPGFIDYEARLRLPAARVFFVWIISLLPGTASVRLTDRGVRVHCLDTRADIDTKLRRLEDHVRALFRDEADA